MGSKRSWSVPSKHLILSGGSCLMEIGFCIDIKDGEAAIDAFADDYAFLAWASIDLYEATFKPDYLRRALELNHIFFEIFGDEENGGFFFSVNDADLPMGRQKLWYDGAVPSANSAAFLNLIRLGRFTGNPSFEEKAQKLGSFSQRS